MATLDDKDSEDEDDLDTTINWSNLIFLPFNPIFRLCVLVVALMKIILVSCVTLINKWLKQSALTL